MLAAFLLCILVLILLSAEKIWVSRNVKNIRLRVHVNGTRGKSTIVKYISTILRLNNFKTISKITGIAPTFFTHNNSAQEIKRRGCARVTEQFKIIHKAAALNSDALVMECMSIDPELQKIESKFFSPKYYIISNIRQDHIEEMGEDENDWVDSICSAIPENCIVLTAEKKFLERIQSSAVSKSSRVISADTIKLDSLPGKFYHEDNLKIALLFAKLEGLRSEKFLQDIYLNPPDEHRISFVHEGNEVNFYNGFAINDVPSAESFLSEIQPETEAMQNIIFVFNSRADRPYRSLFFANWMAGIKNCSRIVLLGNHAERTKKELLKKNFDREKISIWRTKSIDDLISKFAKIISRSVNIVGLGNIKQHGFLTIEAIKQMSRL